MVGQWLWWSCILGINCSLGGDYTRNFWSAVSVLKLRNEKKAPRDLKEVRKGLLHVDVTYYNKGALLSNIPCYVVSSTH